MVDQFMAAIPTTTEGNAPAATAPSSALPSSTASGSAGNTRRQPMASACSRTNTSFFVSPPQLAKRS